MKKLVLIFTILVIFFNVRAQKCDTNLFPNGVAYYDTYHDVASVLSEWKHYNTHDPTVNKQGEWYYMYSTDASWAGLNKTGALKRRSKDLVNWEFLGNAFNGTPQSAQDFFKTVIIGVPNSGKNPSYTDQGIWAPFLLKYKGKYILYYSAPGGLTNVNYAYIGYATSDSASGPWVDQGMITNSYSNSDTINAIDPTVIYDSITHKLWMSYGSWAKGIYVFELDTATGGIKTPGARGVKICNRGTGGQEASEINYRNGWYYLFVSYDGLGDLYNVRVGRSKTPNGPYYDFNGKNMAGRTNNIPMIQSPYRFKNHPGWQGTGHCGVFNDSGTYYMFNQGRPSIEPAMMVLHVRQIFWINDWPVLSPERYAGVPQCKTITADSLLGTWEHLPLIYHINPTIEFHSTSVPLELLSNGTFNNSSANTWTFNNDTLVLSWNSGSEIDKLVVFWGWDWENSCRTILYTGIDTKGKCLWGKKIDQVDVDRHNKLIDGATYTLRNGLSHLLINVPNGLDSAGTKIKQASDNGQSSQLWKIKDAGNGYYYFLPQSSVKHLGIEVKTGANYLIMDTLKGSNNQKLRITSSGNGFFHILTKISDTAKCVDNISSITSSNIYHMTYSKVLNQQWRFEKIDSVAIDTISIDTFPNSGIRLNKLSSIKVYPNPSYGNKINVDLSSMKESKNMKISIIDLKGIIIYSTSVNRPSVYKLDATLPKGIYIIRISSNTQQYINKLIVQ